jgi:hypothetical protein
MEILTMTREDRAMLTEMELLKLAEEESGRLLTETEKWFVWTHPRMTFPEIREMLDKNEKHRKKFEENSI